MSKYFKKADLILFIIILALSVLGFILLRKPASDNAQIEISIGGEVTEVHNLDTDAEYIIETEHGYNTIQVKSGQVRVISADCPNKDCLNFGAISKEGQIILCLPHKLAVRIIGGEEGLDAVSY